MIFGEMPVRDAEECLLAHAIMVGGRKWPKGRILTAEDVAALAAEGHASVIAARLERGDVIEDEAAAAIGHALRGSGIESRPAATGRVNLHATSGGLLVVDAEAIDAANSVHEAVTVATLPNLDVTTRGRMVATVKIIPFAVPLEIVGRCRRALHSGPALRVAPWRTRRVGLVQTRVARIKESILDKTQSILSERLTALDSTLTAERRCAHRQDDVVVAMTELRDTGCDLFLLIGASAITDRADVLPSAVRTVGGTVEHFGMPVDPGNLLMLASWNGLPVLGLPGCARSPKLNGADWILQRIIADIPTAPRDIMGMGVGGLIMDVPERPLPRAKAISSDG